ncbi:protocatechuate 3,4-dioxygenase, alpha subunit [Paracoccus halophilus]|uniref:Protocatechuate 3,4-dioxygenase n=1 Tax=Paracoccus halophilus TaxID=376733 RepID=A0A099F6Z1_9RHOB|nr:protocatechuate 3,4-dioxygenase subunit alpha [Paracoccus halophilus]KGJ06259.1 protocatechuate 3,4-dioxygenase [Paracoccus halophilus]SFA45407.1 protocatechuate 3,4-dioxygenase, alpha subunit [Paracoccus halophilus]
MEQKLDYLRETASQTAGPYVHIGLAPGAAGFDIYRQELGWDIAGPNAGGERIRVEGLVMDGMGSPVKDVLLEVWQANSKGIYAHPEGGGEVEDGFRGWGRVITDFETGEWGFDTVKPGPIVPRGKLTSGVARKVQDTHPDWQGRSSERFAPMAPHLNLWIVARGINIGLNTRMYFEDEAEANASDPVLNLIEWENRRATLIAKRQERDGKPVYRFDIRLQGENETVFFDI